MLRLDLQRGPRSGFTVIEMMIVVLMLVLMMSALGIVSFTGRNAYEHATVMNDLDSRGGRALARVSEELITISGDQMMPIPTTNFGSETLTFVQAVGFAAGNPIWGPNMQIAAEYEATEVDDGIDNDADGLVDERMLVLTRDFGAMNPKRVVLARGLCEWGEGETPNNFIDDNANGVDDEQGFNMHMVGDVISLRLWLQAVDADNQVVVRRIESTVRLRNAGV